MFLVMLGRRTPTAPDVVTFSGHSWIVRLVAAGITLRFVLMAVSSSGGGTVVVVLFGVGLVMPVALLVWNRQRGVHVRADGIRSVSANGSRFLAWSEIAGFEVDPYIAGTIAVHARRPDGSRVALSDTARWPYQRAAVEHIWDELSRYRDGWAEVARRPVDA